MGSIDEALASRATLRCPTQQGLGKNEETKAQDVKRLPLGEAPHPRASSILSALQGHPRTTHAFLQLLKAAYVHWLVTASLIPCPFLQRKERRLVTASLIPCPFPQRPCTARRSSCHCQPFQCAFKGVEATQMSVLP